MGEKTGVLMLMIATLVVSSIFIVINKGSTTEIGEDIRGKMSGIINSGKEGEDDSDKAGEGEYNTGSLVLRIPGAYVMAGSKVGEPLLEMPEYIEAYKGYCEQHTYYCFDVLELDKETGEYKSLGEEAINEIKMDTSKVNMNKEGIYPVSYTYEDKETGDNYKVTSAYQVTSKGMKDWETGVRIGMDNVVVDNYEGKNRLTTGGGKEILLEGDMPTLQELIGNDLLVARWYDADKREYTKKLSNEGFEIDIPYFDRNVPGVYLLEATYTDSDTGETYKDSFVIEYFVGELLGNQSNNIPRR